MWKCTGKLGRADDLHLKEVEYPQQEYTALIQCLEECLEEFLDCDEKGICIAVICGAEGLSYPNDSLSLLETTMEIARYVSRGQYIGRDGQDTTTLTNDYVCIAIRHDGGNDVDAMLGNLYAGISEILKDISEDTVPINGNDSDVSKAKTAIRIVTCFFGPASKNLQQKDLVSPIGDCLDGSCILDHFPRVKILVFMPLDAYGIFEVPENLFFKQIHSVIRIEDPARVIITRDEYESIKRKLDTAVAKAEELQAQRDAAVAELDAAEAKAEELQAQRDAAVAERDAAVAERDAAKAKVEELTAQVKGLIALVKELQSKLAQKVVGPSLLENSDLQTESMEEPTTTDELMEETALLADHNLVQTVPTEKTHKYIKSDKLNKKETQTEDKNQEAKTPKEDSPPSIDKDDSNNPMKDGRPEAARNPEHDHENDGRDRD